MCQLRGTRGSSYWTPDARPALPGSEETGVETSWRRPGRHLRGPRYTAAMKWQRHEDRDIILAVVIICTLAGLARPRLARPGGGGAGFWSGPLTGDTAWAFSEDARSAWGTGPAATWRTTGACGTSWTCTRREYRSHTCPRARNCAGRCSGPNPKTRPGCTSGSANGGDRYVVRHGHDGPGRRSGGVEGRPLRPVREARQVRGRAEGRVGGQGLVLQSQIRKSSLVMATAGSGLVASSPPRPIQDEIRQLVLRPYEAGEQSAHFRHCHGNQLFIRAVVAPLSPCSMA